jgi:hypothetical protein
MTFKSWLQLFSCRKSLLLYGICDKNAYLNDFAQYINEQNEYDGMHINMIDTVNIKDIKDV